MKRTTVAASYLNALEECARTLARAVEKAESYYRAHPDLEPINPEGLKRGRRVLSRLARVSRVPRGSR